MLLLSWEDVFNRNQFTITEKKTGKDREIRINAQLNKLIMDCYHQIKPQTTSEPIFLSQKGTVYSIQRINVVLKEIKIKYRLKINNFSTHSLRKSFGREVFNRSGSNAELALVKLSHLFNHSNTTITRRYLGIAREELLQTYDVLSF